MNVDETKSAISNKFADVPHPGDTHLVHHNRLGTSCDEHPELEKLFGELTWTLKSIESNADQLSFLPPEARRYFYPKFLADQTAVVRVLMMTSTAHLKHSTLAQLSLLKFHDTHALELCTLCFDYLQVLF